MIAKPLFSMLVCFSSTLMLAGTAQAQGLFGFPFIAPYNPQPRYASPCGPNGCPTNVNAGYVSRTNCPGGVCNVSGNGYSSNYVPRGYGMTNGACGPNGCSTGSCANGSCSPSYPNGQRYPSNNGMRTMPHDYGYQSRTLPMPAAPARDYNSNRPSYYYEELPARVAPPTYLDPRSNPYYGAGRGDRYDSATVNRSRSRFETDRSPFYP
ncbi:MAG: hypothetical protein H7062_26295 [Candidatus Saccharimonas sp.]|nr:hypothetical protein [Planctomycetaceae bacterium]